MIPPWIAAAVLAYISLCVASDVYMRRIPNVISGVAMMAGVGLNALYFGAAGLLWSLAGLLVAVAVLLFPFALGGIGGGDVKMMGAVGSLLGPTFVLTALSAGMMLGGIIMAVHLLRRGRLREKLAAIRTMATAAALTRSLKPLQTNADDVEAVTLPYSVPLGLGTITVLALARTLGVS